MKIPYRQLDSLLSEESFVRVWKRLLRTLISSYGDSLLDDEWDSIPLYEIDILSGLTLTEIGILYEYGLTVDSWENRKANGQYFTPEDVSKFMVSLVPQQLNNAEWIDPCCGVGNLSYALGKHFSDPRKFLSKLILADKDPLALLTACVLLSCYAGEGSYDIYSQLRKNSRQGDFLELGGSWDYAILNPPYVSGVERGGYETSSCGDYYAFFMEKIIKNTQGYISVIPQTWMNSSKFSALKNLIMREGQHVKVFSFDNMPDSLFKGVKFGSQNTNQKNSTRGSIISSFPSVSKVEVTPMMRWRAGERHALFSALPDFLSEIPAPDGLVPKVYPGLVNSYYSLTKKKRKLRDILDKRGEYALIVPSSPRYFISASTISLERSSKRVLRFSNIEDMYLAFMVVNSRVMYYWWKVRDNGMSLSMDVLLDVPIPENYDPSPELIERLLRGQNSHKVSKLNAGKNNENIKHSVELVDDVTHEVMSALDVDMDLEILKETAHSSYITSYC